MKVLRPAQRDALRYLLIKIHGALYMDMRLGKCLVVLRLGKLIKPRRPELGLRILVAAPGSAFQGWLDDSTDEGYTFIDLSGEKKSRQRMLKGLGMKEKTPAKKLAFINKEGWIALPEVKNFPWDIVVADESVFIKNPSTKVTKFYMTNFRDVSHRIVLTGTPDPEGVQDFVCPALFLWGRFMGCKNFWEWRARFMEAAWGGFGWKMKPGCSDQVRRYIGQHCFMLRRKDAGLNEKRIYMKRVVTLPPEIRRVYDEIEEDFMSELDGIVVRTKWAGARYQLMRQLTSGFLDGKEVHKVKLKELLELLSGEFKRDQVVVWCCYDVEIFAIFKALRAGKIKCEYIKGGVDGTSKKDRPKVVKDFNTGKFRVLIMQQGLGRGGMDLSGSDTFIYYSTPTGQEARQQTEDRILTVKKAEDETPLLFVDIIVKDSIDEDAQEVLKIKIKGSEDTKERALRKAMKERKKWTSAVVCSDPKKS